MKNKFTKLMAIIAVLLLSIGSANAQASATWTLLTNQTSSVSGNVTATDMNLGSGIVGTSYGSSFGAAPNTSTGWMRCATTAPQLPAAYSATSYVEFTISPAANNNLTVTSLTGNVAGGGSGNVKLAAYYSLDNFATTPGTNLGTCSYNGVTGKTNTTTTPLSLANTSSITTLAEGPIIYSPNIAVNNGQILKIRFYVWSTSTNKYFPLKNIVISGTTVALSTDPIISKTSGNNPANVMELYPLSPVVLYTYSNVADDANVSAEWYTDATYTTTKPAPSGLLLVKDGTANTVTVSGTPGLGTAGTHYYKLIVNETNGNAIEGSVVVSAYVTPTPVIALSSGATTQGIKPGSSIGSIVYNLTNVTGANVTGLPTGISGNFASTGETTGTVTISGTVDGAVTPALNTYTVTATPLAGYAGSPITSTGKIVVKKSDAKSICYLTATATPSANDTKLYPYLNEGIDYMVTVRTAASSAPAPTVYDAFDLIILNEIVAGANLEAVALKSVNKPILSLKAFTYSTGRWSWGTPDNGLVNNGIVTVKQLSHPIFNGITLNAGTLELLSGATGNGIQPSDVSLLGSIVVAQSPKSTTGNPMATAIHDVPGAIRGSGITAKYMLIPVSDVSYGKMTNDALLLISNALTYLLDNETPQFAPPSLVITNFSLSNGSVSRDGAIDFPVEGDITFNFPSGTDVSNLTPTIVFQGTGVSATGGTDFSGSGSAAAPAFRAPSTGTNVTGTPVVYTASDGINSKPYNVIVNLGFWTGINQTTLSGVTFDGKTIRNAENINLKVFDTTGRLVASSVKDINMSSQSKGIYFIKSDNGLLKIALTK